MVWAGNRVYGQLCSRFCKPKSALNNSLLIKKIMPLPPKESGFEFCLCHYRYAPPSKVLCIAWASYLASLSLNFLVCKMGIMIASILEGCCRSQVSRHWHRRATRCLLLLYHRHVAPAAASIVMCNVGSGGGTERVGAPPLPPVPPEQTEPGQLGSH